MKMFAGCFISAWLSAVAFAGDCDWPVIQAQARTGCYWHWLGSAVDEANITRELETFRAAGMGGVHIIPIYGAKGYEERYVEYLSPRWMELLKYTVSEADRLGMFVDMTTGTGWCFGGPNIPDDMASALAAYDKSDNTVRLKPSGSKVKRAAPGGEGWMLNLFQRAAITQYLERFDEAFARYDGPLPRAMYHDSYEYKCDWAPDLLDEFAKRRGYRLEDHFDIFFGDSGSEEQARLKGDYRATQADTILENGIGVWTDWARRLGCKTRNQAHGSPGNLLDLYAAADIPETEMFNKDRDPLASKFASSAAHVMGKECVASETGTWLREHFQEKLADLKNLVDDLFVSGIDEVFYHATCYSPADAPWPGWLFYASTEMNPRNAIWHDVPIFNEYIARCQQLFQSSRPDNDVLLYWPIHDLWHHAKGMEMALTIHKRYWLDEQSIGPAARRLWQKGYEFDYISDRQLAALRMTGDGIAAPGGTYRAILVPRCVHIPVETMHTLRALADAGAPVIFEGAVPDDVPGFDRLDERRAALRALTKDAPFKAGDDFEALLDAAGIVRESLADTPGLFHIRYKHAEGNLYFLANRGAEEIVSYLPLARPAMGAVLLDPMTGQTGVAALREENSRATFFVRLAPGESRLVRTYAARKADGPYWRYFRTGGAPIPVDGTWRVEFVAGGPTLPKPFETASLGSWTKLAQDPAAEAFAGTARYAISFDMPPDRGGDAWRLDLGDVAESARVRLNGADIGAAIMAPYRVDIPLEHIRPTGNTLEIEVTNLSANRIRDLDRGGVKWRIFNDINFVNMDYKPFDASDWPLFDSGLLGPITLIPLLEADIPR